MNEKICNHCGCSNPMENNYCASCGSPFEDRVPNAKRKGEGLSKKTMFLVSLAVTVVINVCMALLLNALVPMGNASCSHEWDDADCRTYRECRLCGETDDDLGDHIWLPATCIEPEKCSVCGEQRNAPLGHIWKPASCSAPESCSICGESRGTPLDHVWTAATYTEPETCEVCKATSGVSLRTQLTDFLRQKLPFTTYSASLANKVYGYEDAGLTKKSDKYNFVPSIDELVITDISEDGSAVQVCYPSTTADSGYRTLWFPLEDVIPLVDVKIGRGETADKLTTYRLDQKENGMVRYGVMAANSDYTTLGTHESGYIVVHYHITETQINGCAVTEKIALIQP